MTKYALFSGLIYDENDNPVNFSYVGNEPVYIIDDQGFKRHVSSEYIDRQVWEQLTSNIAGNEKFLADQTAKMLKVNDIFSQAVIENQLKNVSQQFESMQTIGIPADNKSYLEMMGFKIVVNIHGDVIRLDQPADNPPLEEE